MSAAMHARQALKLTTASMLTLTLVGCLSPRDADLDERVSTAVLKQHLDRATRGASGAVAAVTGGAAPVTPHKRTLKTYSEADIKRIMGKVPGDGTTLSMVIKTRLGEIHCELDRDNAPQTVTNVVALATGQLLWRDPDTGKKSRSRFYTGLPFHRLVRNFLIQTGNPAVSRGRGPAWKSKGPGWVVAREDTANARYDKPGAMGMVDAGEDSHGSQFFITTKRATHLKNKYAALGTCDNLDIVSKIANAPRLDPDKEKPTKPKDPVHIDAMEIRWTAGK